MLALRPTYVAFFTLLAVTLRLCSAQAPGDEAARCTTDHSSPPVYPDNERTLMDSYSYVNLLPGNGTGQPPEDDAVWNAMSFDGNDVDGTFNPTYWQQGAGGICRYQVRVCGYRQNGSTVPQNNWLFTQHISKHFDPSIFNYPVPIQVEITYALQSCRERNGCNPQFSLLTYITNTPQLPSTLGNGFMNRNNYGNNVTIEPERTSVTYTDIYNFTLQPNEMGLYLAAQDYGTCLGISRLRVYRNNCQGFQTGLVVYPDAPAPVSGSVNINVACVDNAVFSGSDQVTCASDGTWGPENPVCQCSPGYEDRGTECVPTGLPPAQAPGDEAARCTSQHSNPPVYPDNERTLMDSYSYVNLLPGNGTGQPPEDDAVWNDMSYDGNDVVDTLNPTYWQQGAGGICRYQVRVCGYRQNGDIVPQNNWLFTQHISKDFNPSIFNYPVPMRVEITYALQSCRERNGCNPRFSLLTYITNTPQLPSTLGNGFMNRNNYGNNMTIEPERTSATFTDIYNFTLQPNEMGLYLAAHDYGTCVGISRLRVYRNNCQGLQTGLVVYPDAPAPVSGSANINVACVDNAVFSGSDQVTCASDGTWGPENPVCQCSPGYEDRETECVPIETGVVTGLQGRYPYIVWDAPEQCQSNGVITRYSLRFTRDGMTYVVTTASDQTFYVIEDGIVPWTSGSFDVTVQVGTSAGFGRLSDVLTLPIDPCSISTI